MVATIITYTLFTGYITIFVFSTKIYQHNCNKSSKSYRVQVKLENETFGNCLSKHPPTRDPLDRGEMYFFPCEARLTVFIGFLFVCLFNQEAFVLNPESVVTPDHFRELIFDSRGRLVSTCCRPSFSYSAAYTCLYLKLFSLSLQLSNKTYNGMSSAKSAHTKVGEERVKPPS